MLGIHLILLALITFSFGVCSFAMGIWIYQTTGSIAAFTMVGVAAILPAFLLTPLAGVLVDRLTPQRSILYNSAVSTLGCLILAVLLYFNAHVGLLMVPLLIMSAFMAFLGPAYHTMVAQIADTKRFEQMNGFIGIGHSLTLLGSPLVAAFLMEIVNAYILALIPCITFAIQFLVLLFFDSRPKRDKNKIIKWGFMQELKQVIHFMRGRRDILLLMSLAIILLLISEFLEILTTPFGLELFDKRSVGFLVTIGGVGALMGNIALTVISNLKRKIVLILVLHVSQGILLISLAKTSMTFVVVSLAFCAFFFLESIYEGIDLAYWQENAPDGIQASVLSFKAWSSLFSKLLAYLSATPLVAFIADHGFFAAKKVSEFTPSASALVSTVSSLGYSNLVIVLLFAILFGLVLSARKKQVAGVPG